MFWDLVPLDPISLTLPTALGCHLGLVWLHIEHSPWVGLHVWARVAALLALPDRLCACPFGPWPNRPAIPQCCWWTLSGSSVLAWMDLLPSAGM